MSLVWLFPVSRQVSRGSESFRMEKSSNIAIQHVPSLYYLRGLCSQRVIYASPNPGLPFIPGLWHIFHAIHLNSSDRRWVLGDRHSLSFVFFCCSEKITIYYYKSNPVVFRGIPVVLNFTESNCFLRCCKEGEKVVLQIEVSTVYKLVRSMESKSVSHTLIWNFNHRKDFHPYLKKVTDLFLKYISIFTSCCEATVLTAAPWCSAYRLYLLSEPGNQLCLT